MRSVLRAGPFTRDNRTCAIIGVYLGWLLLDALVRSYTGHPGLWSRWTLLPLALIPIACLNLLGGRPYRWWHLSAAMLAFPAALAVASAVLRPRPGIPAWQVLAVGVLLVVCVSWIFVTLPHSDEEWATVLMLREIRARKEWEAQVRDTAARAAARRAARRQAGARTPDRQQEARPPIGARLGPSIGWRTHHASAGDGTGTCPDGAAGASDRCRTRDRRR